MRLFTAPRLALAAVVPALFVLSVVPGCSNEGEGERCGDPGGAVSDNSDCGSGLVCTAFPMYAGSIDTVGRCCYPDHVTDSRCLKSNNTSATGSTSGGSSGSDAGVTPGDAGGNAAVAGGGTGGAASTTPDLPAGAGGSAGSP